MSEREPLFWRGRLIESMTRDELLDAFYVAAEMLREAQASADELLRVAWEWRSPPS